MKKLSNLKGAKALNRQEQKSINGGKALRCVHSFDVGLCPTNYPYYCGYDKCCSIPCN